MRKVRYLLESGEKSKPHWDDLRGVENDREHDSRVVCRVGHASVPGYVISKHPENNTLLFTGRHSPQSQIPKNNGPSLQARVAWAPNLAPLIQLALSDHGLSKLTMVVEVRVLRAQPQLGRTVLGPAVDQTGVICDGEGVLGVLEAKIGMDMLALLRRKEGVGSDEVDFGARAEDVGHDAGGMLVCIYLGIEVL
jgi:hypothetical protein